MELAELVAFLRQSKLAVQASVRVDGAPQAAVVGFVVSDAGELFFDTSTASRKCQNLRRDARIALVVGWDERTVQYEGIADEPTGEELARFKALYFASFPEGRERERWPDIAYFRVRPRWLRYSDFTGSTPSLAVLEFAAARD
ncbi:MAG: pyridoxamine 5'-phosphate oxidase family protein [Polyangiaceae bacterium]